MPIRTIEDRHISAIKVLEVMLDRTKYVPSILNNYQKTINLQMNNNNEQQEQDQHRRQQKKHQRREREKRLQREADASARTREAKRVIIEAVTILKAEQQRIDHTSKEQTVQRIIRKSITPDVLTDQIQTCRSAVTSCSTISNSSTTAFTAATSFFSYSTLNQTLTPSTTKPSVI